MGRCGVIPIIVIILLAVFAIYLLLQSSNPDQENYDQDDPNIEDFRLVPGGGRRSYGQWRGHGHNYPWRGWYNNYYNYPRGYYPYIYQQAYPNPYHYYYGYQGSPYW